MDKKIKQTEEERAFGYRLNKFIAHAGICSRRKAAELVKQGKIKVNDVVERNPGYVVQKNDHVEYKGRPLRRTRNFTYVLMNKPKNTITTTNDEKGRLTVVDIVQKRIDKRLYPIGRLDRNTTGLLILTNDGDLTQKLSHPSFNTKKVYYVTLDKALEEEHFEAIKNGLELEDGVMKVDGIIYRENLPKTEISVEIHSGKNRIVRRLFEHFNYSVEKLDRIYYAGLTKKKLPRGWVRRLTEKEVIMLKHFT